MAVFSQEIINLIVRQCDDYGTLWNLLTVSRACQEPVEQRLWPDHVCIVDDDGVKVLRRYTGRRFRFLRRVTLEQDFPMLEDEGLSCRETADEVRENDELLTRRIAAVFTAIKALEKGLNDESAAQTMNVALTITTPRQWVHDPPCGHRCYHSWRLHLLRPKTLPRLESVKKLVVGSDTQEDHGPNFAYHPVRDNRYLHPLHLRVVPDLLSKLPYFHSLESIDIQDSLPFPFDSGPVLDHYARPFEGPRRDSRHGFARAVEERGSSSSSLSSGIQLYPSLKTLSLHLGRTHTDGRSVTVDQGKRLPNLVTSSPDTATTTTGDASASRQQQQQKQQLPQSRHL